MGKASFSVEKLTQNTQTHISRTNNFSCAIVENSNNNSFKLFYEYDDFLEKAQTRYKEKVKQNMQKSAVLNIFQESIISIDEHHFLDDIIDLFFELKQKFGGHELINLTIHKDEGYFLKDNIAYYPNKNIIKNGLDWYIQANDSLDKKEKDFSVKVNINEFKKVLNPHAHAVFSMFDFSLGRNARMQKIDMVERLKFVATILKMDYSVQKSYKILDSDMNLDIKESELKDLDSQILQKTSNLIELNTQIGAKEIEFEEIKVKLANQQSILNDISNKISQKESDLEDLNTQLFLKEEDLDKLKNIVSIKNTTINSLNLTIKQKEFKIDELDNKIYATTQNVAI